MRSTRIPLDVISSPERSKLELVVALRDIVEGERGAEDTGRIRMDGRRGQRRARTIRVLIDTRHEAHRQRRRHLAAVAIAHDPPGVDRVGPPVLVPVRVEDVPVAHAFAGRIQLEALALGVTRSCRGKEDRRIAHPHRDHREARCRARTVPSGQQAGGRGDQQGSLGVRPAEACALSRDRRADGGAPGREVIRPDEGPRLRDGQVAAEVGDLEHGLDGPGG